MGAHAVEIKISDSQQGPVIPEDFAGLSFERGPLNPGNAGVPGYLFSPSNQSLITLFRNLGLRSLRIGGGSVDTMVPASQEGVDNLFAFAREAGAQVIFSLRLLNPAQNPIQDLKAIDTEMAGYIWSKYQEELDSFSIGNEPDWHSYHISDPAIYETVPAVPGSAYPSFLADWRGFADAVMETAPQARFLAPETGAYSRQTYTPDPGTGVSWTEKFADDEGCSGRISQFTQHHYAGGSPGATTPAQAISNMLSPEWVNATAPGSQPAGTTYTPYPWLYENNLAHVARAGLSYRMTEANDYLTGVHGASDAFASALWALDYLHWWAARGAAGVNFHNKQWLYTDTIVPAPGGGYAVNPKGYGFKAFTLGAVGSHKPITIENGDHLNVTAYCTAAAGVDYVTIINKTYGPAAADADVTIRPAAPGLPGADVMILTSTDPGDVAATDVTLGGAKITGDEPWQGTWAPLPPHPNAVAALTVKAATAAVVRIHPA
jgi:hypothetical protein